VLLSLWVLKEQDDVLLSDNLRNKIKKQSHANSPISQSKTLHRKKVHQRKNLEDLMFANCKCLFGQSSILIEAKKKIDNKALGGTIPDAFLFDLKDPDNPEFYLIEVELAKHSFYNHIFPQITKFFAFFKNPESQSELIEKLYTLVSADAELKKEFKSRIGNKEIFKYIKDTIENSQNILLILDNDKKELPEITKTYTDTWGKIVKVTLLKEYTNNGESIISLTPEFENIDTVDFTEEAEETSTPYTEDYHLEGVSRETKNIYSILKNALTEQIKDLKYNPQRYYISLRKKRNFAFLQVRKKKITVVALLEPSKIEDRIKHHKIVQLSDSVQKFYNGSCAKIIITDNKHIDEIIKLLVEIQK
jgi:predicted transport protein